MKKYQLFTTIILTIIILSGLYLVLNQNQLENSEKSKDFQEEDQSQIDDSQSEITITSVETLRDKVVNDLELPATWQTYPEDLGMEGFIKEDNYYTFNKDECTKSQWEENDMCKYFDANFTYPILSQSKSTAAFISIHQISDPQKSQEFLELYKNDIDKNPDCTGGVVMDETNTYFVNINIAEGNNADDIYVILEEIKKLTNFNLLYSCQN